ncbi:hypothetical protein ACFX15_019313 [Malus domestica]
MTPALSPPTRSRNKTPSSSTCLSTRTTAASPSPRTPASASTTATPSAVVSLTLLLTKLQMTVPLRYVKDPGVLLLYQRPVEGPT